MDIRNRIKEHRHVKASELRPHPLNFRTHPESQQAALDASMREVGFARSLLAYEDPEHGLTLIDGHLRRDQLGDELVTVEIVDVSPEEARKLLLSLDPLSGLAGTDSDALSELLASTSADEPVLAAFWESIAASDADSGGAASEEPDEVDPPASFAVLIQCRDETQQAAVLKHVLGKGWKAKSLLS